MANRNSAFIFPNFLDLLEGEKITNFPVRNSFYYFNAVSAWNSLLYFISVSVPVCLRALERSSTTFVGDNISILIGT